MTRSGGDGGETDHAVFALAHELALEWLRNVPERRVPPSGTADEVKQRLGTDLPASPAEPVDVLRRLSDAVTPALMASQSGRFYGWVMGGTYPVGIAADWLVSAWDQNAGMRDWTPGVVGVEELAGEWLLELLGLPRRSSVGFVTGGTMGNFACLAAARACVLERAGWNLDRDGLNQAPRIRVLVGRERHDSIDLVLRYLGLGAPEPIDVDEQGRVDVGALDRALGAGDGPTIVCLQAGNIHSGAFDLFEQAIGVAHRAGAWVHVDGAFGLWAAAVPALEHLTRGLAGADSWATDAHKTLNVPYDCGISIVAAAKWSVRAFRIHADYLPEPSALNPFEHIPELSRRARGVPVWAVLAALGADGVRDLVAGLVSAARGIAEGLAVVPGLRVLNDVVYTQVSVAFDSDDETRRVFERVLDEGVVLPSISRWHDRNVIRISVSNRQTGRREVEQTVAAFERAARVR